MGDRSENGNGATAGVAARIRGDVAGPKGAGDPERGSGGRVAHGADSPASGGVTVTEISSEEARVIAARVLGRWARKG